MGLLESLIEKATEDITPMIREEVLAAMEPLYEKLDEIAQTLRLIEEHLRPKEVTVIPSFRKKEP